MESKILYQRLEQDFVTPEMSDDWAQYMESVSDFLCQNFKNRSMGLVCDFAAEIKKVYTAVFPSDNVLQYILDNEAYDAMLFVHHPSTWDIRCAPEIFQQMNIDLLKQFKDRRISIFNFHVPLDNYGEYSTSVTFAKALGINPEVPYAPYYGALAGVFGKIKFESVYELKERFEKAVGHNVILYKYGEDKIRNNVVAVVAGGGLDTMDEIAKNNINTFVTGISVKNTHSEKAHKLAEDNKINILGGTHYSTEKFACISITEYFMKIGLSSEFIDDKPVLEDM
jgi:putative NIF3 family GTP cyclohydrolase 1 type 2